jgi:hypothetical protein
VKPVQKIGNGHTTLVKQHLLADSPLLPPTERWQDQMRLRAPAPFTREQTNKRRDPSSCRLSLSLVT